MISELAPKEVARLFAGLLLVAVGLIPLLLIAWSIWVLRGDFSPLVDGCGNVDCLDGVDSGLLYASWVADYGPRLKILNVIAFDILGIIGIVAGSVLLWKRARAMALGAVLVVVVALIWQWTHRQMIDEIGWIFN